MAMMVLLAIAVGSLVFGFIVFGINGIAEDQSFICKPDFVNDNYSKIVCIIVDDDDVFTTSALDKIWKQFNNDLDTFDGRYMFGDSN